MDCKDVIKQLLKITPNVYPFVIYSNGDIYNFPSELNCNGLWVLPICNRKEFYSHMGICILIDNHTCYYRDVANPIIDLIQKQHSYRFINIPNYEKGFDCCIKCIGIVKYLKIKHGR